MRAELEDAEQKVPEIRKTDNNVCEVSMIQEPATNGVKRMMETMEILMTLERSYELITSMPTVAEYPGDDIPGAGAGAVTTKLSQGVTREAPKTSIGDGRRNYNRHSCLTS
ncbi:hypothetical protein YC2023_052885 [Brassica napus]